MEPQTGAKREPDRASLKKMVPKRPLSEMRSCDVSALEPPRLCR